MNASRAQTLPRTPRGAACPLAARATPCSSSSLLLQSWCAFRRRRRHRSTRGATGTDSNPPSSPGWQAAEWAPTQPAIVFGGEGGASAAAAAAAPSASSASPPSSSSTKQPISFRLAVYTKPGCPLCENLADRAQAVLDRAAFLPGGGALALAGVDVRRVVERRDVSLPGNEAWARLHAGEVPVLVMLMRRIGGDDEKQGEEEEVPVARPPPRVTADKLERHLAAAAAEVAAAMAAASDDDQRQQR